MIRIINSHQIRWALYDPITCKTLNTYFRNVLSSLFPFTFFDQRLLSIDRHNPEQSVFLCHAFSFATQFQPLQMISPQAASNMFYLYLNLFPTVSAPTSGLLWLIMKMTSWRTRGDCTGNCTRCQQRMQFYFVFFVRVMSL